MSVSIETISAPEIEIATPDSTSRPKTSWSGLSQVENSIRNTSENCSSGITSMTGATATAEKKKPCAIATNTPGKGEPARVLAA